MNKKYLYLSIILLFSHSLYCADDPDVISQAADGARRILGQAQGFMGMAEGLFGGGQAEEFNPASLRRLRQMGEALGSIMGGVTETVGDALTQQSEKRKREHRYDIERLNAQIGRHQTNIALYEDEMQRNQATEQQARRQAERVEGYQAQLLNQQADRCEQQAIASGLKIRREENAIKELEKERDGYTRDDGAEFIKDAAEKTTAAAREIFVEKMTGTKRTEAALNANATRLAAVQRMQAVLAHLSDGKKLSYLAGAFILAAAGIYAAKEGTKVLADYIESQIGKPILVRESSRETLASSVYHNFFPQDEDAGGIENVILNPEQSDLLMEIADATRESQENGDLLMNLLFYGPPGTGKTMFAKALAHYSNCDYAIMSGADFSQFDEGEDITELHKLFTWAQTSRRPLVIFVDEAEAFLASRSHENVTERSKKLTDAFLSQVTGQSSENVMFVFATNIPEVLDRAVLDRIGERVEFTLPGPVERAKILELHLDEYTEGKGLSVAEDVTTNIKILSEEMDGFSGRTIAGIVLKALRSTRVNRSGIITYETLLNTIKREKATIEQEATQGNYI